MHKIYVKVPQHFIEKSGQEGHPASNFCLNPTAREETDEQKTILCVLKRNIIRICRCKPKRAVLSLYTPHDCTLSPSAGPKPGPAPQQCYKKAVYDSDSQDLREITVLQRCKCVYL